MVMLSGQASRFSREKWKEMRNSNERATKSACKQPTREFPALVEAMLAQKRLAF
jgi:hypothetical protein